MGANSIHFFPRLPQNQLVRQIKSKKQAISYYEAGYKKYQQCWAKFKCPDNMYAYWRRAKFQTMHNDYVVFYGVNNFQYRRYSGNYGSSSSWYTLYDNEITFEFKSGGSNPYNYYGFEILLICK